MSASDNLLMYYVGFGYALCLFWAAVLFDAVKSNPPPWTRTATVVLLVAGFAHPAAALAAWDLRRELSRDRSNPDAKPSVSLAAVLASVVIAVVVVVWSQA